MNYDREILCVLGEAGEKGLSVKKIARHVFNRRNGFFDEVSFDNIYHYVAAYLTRNSKDRDSLVEKTECRGVYRLNMSSAASRQLVFDFKEQDDNIRQEEKNTEDRSLSLF